MVSRRRHFFSSLFLVVYRSVGVAPERRLFYGGLNHAIRGIVTGTDNLLDDEYKEMLQFSAQVTERIQALPHNPAKAALVNDAKGLAALVNDSGLALSVPPTGRSPVSPKFAS